MSTELFMPSRKWNSLSLIPARAGSDSGGTGHPYYREAGNLLWLITFGGCESKTAEMRGYKVLGAYGGTA